MFEELMPHITYLQSRPWLLFAAVVAGFFLISKLAHIIFVRIFSKLAKRTKTEFDDRLVEATSGPISWILLFFGFRIGFTFFGDGIWYYEYGKMLADSLLIICATVLLVRIIDVLIDTWGHAFAKRTKSHVDDQLIILLHRFCRIFFGILGVLFILDVWGVKVGPLLASLGIAGIAVAFALQQSLSNIFGGLSIILDKTLKVGDLVALDEVTQGEVVDIGLRTTKIRNWDNELVIIPNGTVSNTKITNWVKPNRKERVVIKFGVAYGSKPERVKKIVIDSIKKIEGLSEDPKPLVRMTEMKDSALEFKLYFFVDDIKYRFMAVSNATENIYNALNKAKISIPFPQLDVHVKKK